MRSRGQDQTQACSVAAAGTCFRGVISLLGDNLLLKDFLSLLGNSVDDEVNVRPKPAVCIPGCNVHQPLALRNPGTLRGTAITV
jgi:hypothetical protein